MRITYLMESVGRTGGNVVLFHHMEALARDGHDVHMISPFGEKCWKPGSLLAVEEGQPGGYDGIWGYAKKLQSKARKIAPQVERRVMSAFRGNAYQYSADLTQRLLSQWRDSDVTVATHSFTAHAAALLSERTRSYYHMQGYEPWFNDDPSFQAIAGLSYKLPLRKIANCKWLFEKIAQISGDEIRLVRPGLNHQIFYPREIFASKRKGRDATSSVKIVSYADSRPLKGWLDSQAAMRNVFDRLGSRFKIEWSVFGNIDSGDVGVPVNYCGFLSHEKLAELYSDADIVFVPSWFESFPLQPIEAMACGAAVVTTRIGTDDYARHDETALVVDPRSPDSLAGAIIDLVVDRARRGRISEEGLREARKFTWEQSASEIKVALDL